jgi:hypothetical protein
MDDRRVETMKLENWVIANSPQAMEKLSVASGVSIPVIHHARHGRAPKRRTTRLRLARAINETEDGLFPIQKRQEAAS